MKFASVSQSDPGQLVPTVSGQPLCSGSISYIIYTCTACIARYGTAVRNQLASPRAHAHRPLSDAHVHKEIDGLLYSDCPVDVWVDLESGQNKSSGEIKGAKA